MLGSRKSQLMIISVDVASHSSDLHMQGLATTDPNPRAFPCSSISIIVMVRQQICQRSGRSELFDISVFSLKLHAALVRD